MKFKNGDKVAVYDFHGQRRLGKIIEMGNDNGHNYVDVRISGNRGEQRVHPKQCRRLTKKRIWVQPFDGRGLNVIRIHISQDPEATWDEYARVRKAKREID